jgi:hypothetical protein
MVMGFEAVPLYLALGIEINSFVVEERSCERLRALVPSPPDGNASDGEPPVGIGVLCMIGVGTALSRVLVGPVGIFGGGRRPVLFGLCSPAGGALELMFTGVVVVTDGGAVPRCRPAR